MELSNIDGIYAEYSFIENFLPRAKANVVKVSRWDKTFLEHENLTNVGVHDSARFGFYLLDGDGKIVTRVGGSNKRFFSPLFMLGLIRRENVAQALYRIGSKARMIRYAVQYHGSELHFLKLPREHKNAEDWYNAEMKEDREAMREI